MNTQEQCAMVESFLNALRDELRLIAPQVEEVHISHSTWQGWSAWTSFPTGVSADYQDRSEFAYGKTLPEAVEKLRVSLKEWQRKMDARTLCCVEGCRAEAVATTGEGRMCREHALAWLQGEKEDSEAQQNVDMG